MSLRRTHLLVESTSIPPKRLYVFDFDGTLAITPGPDRANLDLLRYVSRGFTNSKGSPSHRWWSDHRSLQEPFDVLPLNKTIKQYRQAKGDGRGLTVIMTGRVDRPRMREAVSAALKKIGISGHQHGKDLFLKPPSRGGHIVLPAEWKAHMLKRFCSNHPSIGHVYMWDDKQDHLRLFGEVLKGLGVKHALHHVRDPNWKWD